MKYVSGKTRWTEFATNIESNSVDQVHMVAKTPSFDNIKAGGLLVLVHGAVAPHRVSYDLLLVTVYMDKATRLGHFSAPQRRELSAA